MEQRASARSMPTREAALATEPAAVAEPASPAGHRLLPHTGDCIVEAWGPDRAACLVEALSGLVETFADVPDEAIQYLLPIGASGEDPQDELLALLEEVIYVVDVFGVVPTHFHLAVTDDGAVSGDMEVVPVNRVTLTGPPPRSVEHHELSITEHVGQWNCRAVVEN